MRSGTAVACPNANRIPTPPHSVHPPSSPTPSPRLCRLQDEMRFKVLHALQQQPDMNQRQLAELLGVSLGKTNYLLRALVAKGENMLN